MIHINIQMKKFKGIYRNKWSELKEAKINLLKKKNRFKSAGKDDDFLQSPTTNSFMTHTTKNSMSEDSLGETSKTLEVYDRAKQNLSIIGQLKKKITSQCKMRMTVFKEAEAKKYDENICVLSKKAVEHILKAEKCLNEIRQLKSSNESEEKYYRNMEKSLALEIRETSRELRAQEKEHYERLNLYERGTKNKAIELSQTQKQKMKDSYLQMEDFQQSTITIIEQDNRDQQISSLVQSINKLSEIYKELNLLVIEQGSIIDRIDVNIEQTLTHVEAGNEHLQKAQQHVSSSCAQKCMLILVIIIFILAIIWAVRLAS